MKTRILIAGLLLALTGCKKSSMQNELIGNWNVENVDGQAKMLDEKSMLGALFLGSVFHEFKFTADSIYMLDKDGNVVDKVSYTIEQRQDEAFVRINLNDEEKTVWRLKDKKLTISNTDFTMTLSKPTKAS